MSEQLPAECNMNRLLPAGGGIVLWSDGPNRLHLRSAGPGGTKKARNNGITEPVAIKGHEIFSVWIWNTHDDSAIYSTVAEDII